MGNTHTNIEYDREKFYSGQMVSGRVLLRLDKPKQLKAVKLTLKGKAKCRWTTRRGSFTHGHVGKETLFKTSMNLVVEAKKIELPVGVYVYPFSVPLPSALPSSYQGRYGGITYCGRVKIDVPWIPDKVEGKKFIVESLLNLNYLPVMNRAYIHEDSKTFSFWCCANGSLTLTVEIPRTAYVFNEPIPFTIEVDNTSNIRVNAVKIALRQKIHWKANDNTSRSEDVKLKTHKLGAVDEKKSKRWNENLWLGPNKYPNANCRIIRINYELEIKLDIDGPFSHLEKRIPITIGDIPYSGSGEVMNPSEPPPEDEFAPPSALNPTLGYTPGPYPGWFCS